MSEAKLQHLSRRERQILDIVYRRERVTAADVQRELPDPPSYTTVRTWLRLIEEKGLLRHTQEGARYVYEPTISHEKAQSSAMQRVLDTFFGGSPSRAIAALIDMSDELPQEEIAELNALLADARNRGR